MKVKVKEGFEIVVGEKLYKGGQEVEVSEQVAKDLSDCLVKEVKQILKKAEEIK